MTKRNPYPVMPGYRRRWRRTPIERFEEKYVVDPTGCWIWSATKASGYGMFSFQGRRMGAHRWSYEYHVGPIPERAAERAANSI